MAERSNICLNLSNRPEDVVVVREMLSGLAETIDLDGNDLDDMRSAVTEACNNVVLHAYRGAEGPLRVGVYVSSGAINVVVRDHGIGISPQVRTAADTSTGIGLSVIRALAHRVEFRSPAESGTEVRMEFNTPGTQALASIHSDELELPTGERPALATTAAIAIAPTSLARTVLPRVMSVLAARAYFSTDRLSDAQLVADALVAYAPGSISGSHLNVAVNVEPRNLEMRIGPLDTGRARRLILDSAPVIEKLTDAHGIGTVGSAEMLALRLIDRR